jgi:ATP-dependent Clp protease ATP-binding subunit ClpA
MNNPTNRSKVRSIDPLGDLGSFLAQRLVGQPAAIAAIVPFIQIYRAMLSPEGRPAGIFLLLGPTGTGKTKTVEALAEVLHGHAKKLLKVDCGEFQMDHEVAKLIGAPPGYLGHRETQPWLTQQKVNAASSEACDVSLVLFDEVEKAAPTMTRLLLGILDKAALRLGDGTTVNFEKTLIFLTSNLGAEIMAKELNPDFGFESLMPRKESDQNRRLESIGMAAVRKQFSPEFVNRIDVVVTYKPLGSVALAAILDQEVRQLQDHLDRRLGERTFHLEVPARARRFLIERGTSKEYGARELKRTMQRQLIQPLAGMMVGGEIGPGGRVRAEVNTRKDKLVLRDLDSEKYVSSF